MTFREHMISLHACSAALHWLGNRTASKAWAECERADWLLWWAARDGADHVVMVRAACACARRSLRFVPAGEDRPRLAIEATEQWASNPGNNNLARVAKAARAAEAAGAAEAAEHREMCVMIRGIICQPWTEV